MQSSGEWYNADMAIQRIDLLQGQWYVPHELSVDGSHVVSSQPPEIRARLRTVTAPSYAEAFRQAFGQYSAYVGPNRTTQERSALERAGIEVIIVPKS